ncbi:predicted protein [Uncinocarpus reesii 1704]|uniref:rRNA biogenesis protein RRP36 n=1 Tax=Uncinocarpus reesii (strain UAMH 1704) TaxID=336963 RepID=C4JP11_UNCRE|nr:uncharacterized protein UREG_03070 [Uncinocarpus reesii 1704]EEP78225.1 predicted protein [Uncinocarpus reesii 1704]
MALLDALNRRIKARVDEDDSEVFSESSSEQADIEVDSDLEESESESGSEAEIQPDEESSDASASEPEDVNTTLNQISFGALAKAQTSLGHDTTTRKRAHTTTTSPLDDIRARIRATRDEKASKPPSSSAKKETPPTRSSKHAPTIQSSKHAVSRRRTVVDAGATAGPKPRDPRFDSAVQHTGNPHAAKNYAFLDEYRSSEVSALRRQIAQSTDAAEQARLRRQLTSMADRMRAFERKRQAEEVVAGHRRRERGLIREGKKSAPFFLKKGDVKRKVLKKRYAEMGGKERTKSIERRRKKMASRERREMPATRRVVEG